MPDGSFGSLLIVAAIAATAPLLIGLTPRLRIPAVVLEIVAGIVVGPSGLGWVRIDLPIQILSLLGLAFLLFLAGLEIDLNQLRGRLCATSAKGGSGVEDGAFGCGAASVMEVGPPPPPCRGRWQTTASCVGE
jgi:Kef-type K+ transport system membrane component KefB